MPIERDVAASLVRVDAAEALGRLGDVRAVEPFIQALRDAGGTVRENAAEGLGKLGDTRAVEPLIEALRDELSVVRKNAAEGLGKLGDVRAAGPLITILKVTGRREWAVRKAAASALAAIASKTAPASIPDLQAARSLICEPHHDVDVDSEWANGHSSDCRFDHEDKHEGKGIGLEVPDAFGTDF